MVKNPHNYNTKAAVIKYLKEHVIPEIEASRSNYVNFNIQLWFATTDDIRKSLERDHGKEKAAELMAWKEQLGK